MTQLHVDGKPYLVLGGELGNSTASDLNVLGEALAKCRRMNLNTVLLPVYWDLVEPRESEFDFDLVRGAIDRARALDLRLVYLWFGTWKNSMSCYAPGWVKRDTARFVRARRSSGEAMEIISPACAAAADSDARAFSALMRWTREYDSESRTVIMVQVENEIGMIPEARDHSEQSEIAYRGEVPDALVTLALRGHLGPEVGALWEKAGRNARGPWSEVFGTRRQCEEVFSAWQFATYVERVASAGKREYALPMFANAALIRPGYEPGQYPSAGPLPHLLEIWRTGAPSLDMICPDIYFPNFMEWCDRYVRGGNPLFIGDGRVDAGDGECGVFGSALWRHGIRAVCHRGRRCREGEAGHELLRRAGGNVGASSSKRSRTGRSSVCLRRSASIGASMTSRNGENSAASRSRRDSIGHQSEVERKRRSCPRSALVDGTRRRERRWARP